MKVILDTNFLLIPHKFHVDIFSEIERLVEGSVQYCIVDKTLDELMGIAASGNGEDARAAKLGLMLIKGKSHILMKMTASDVDSTIVMKADKDSYVCTMDRELKERLREKNIKIITLREKSHLEIV